MKIFIIMRDRLAPVLKLLPWIEDVHEIVFLDNNSVYPPLLEFYENTPHRVIRFRDNVGHLAPWTHRVTPDSERYVVTDPDVVPDPQCPPDFMKVMEDVLDAAPDIQKVGFGLRIDDLPDHYARKPDVINWERGLWGCRRDVLGYEGHEVPIDTTFAMYREGVTIKLYCSPTEAFPALRLGPPYVAQHLAWYSDSKNPTDEEKFYKTRANRQIANWLFDDASETHSK